MKPDSNLASDQDTPHSLVASHTSYTLPTSWCPALVPHHPPSLLRPFPLAIVRCTGGLPTHAWCRRFQRSKENAAHENLPIFRFPFD